MKEHSREICYTPTYHPFSRKTPILTLILITILIGEKKANVAEFNQTPVYRGPLSKLNSSVNTHIDNIGSIGDRIDRIGRYYHTPIPGRHQYLQYW